MAFSLSSLNLAEVKADLVKVEAVVAVVEKYENLLPIPVQVKTAVADLAKALTFAADVLSEV